VVAGPRQVGKTTLVQQGLERSKRPFRFASADEPTLRGTDWIEQQWETARFEALKTGKRGSVLVLDEVQKIPAWSEAVKQKTTKSNPKSDDFSKARPRPQARRATRTRGRPHARHANLCLEGRQDNCHQAVARNGSAADPGALRWLEVRRGVSGFVIQRRQS